MRVCALLLALMPAFAACAAPVKEAPPPRPAERHHVQVDAGRWAEYEETYLGSATIKERVALVAKGADGNTLETTTDMGGGNTTVFATVFAGGIGGGAQLVGSAFQVSDDEPMQAPPVPPNQQPYPPVDPKAIVGVDTVSTRAGTFRAKHYRDRTGYGEQVDYWIDDSVGPIGLIKLEAEQRQHPTIRAGFTFQLVATGNDAIPQITRPARPFDASVLKKRGLPWTRQKRIGPQPPAKVVQ